MIYFLCNAYQIVFIHFIVKQLQHQDTITVKVLLHTQMVISMTVILLMGYVKEHLALIPTVSMEMLKLKRKINMLDHGETILNTV